MGDADNEIGGIPDGIEKVSQDDHGVTEEEVIKSDIVEHTTHLWKRGMLPGGKYVKTCSIGGEIVEIPFGEWQTISDR